MPGTHAILSASGAERWMACPPSARLEQTFPDSTSAFAEEGTHAHALAELMLRKRYMTGLGPRAFQKALDGLTADPRYTVEMPEHVKTYTDYVEERYNAALAVCMDPLIAVEQRLDLTRWVPEAFGTGDAIIVADGTLEIIDLKYGKGIPVQAEGNPQLRLYGLGAYAAFCMLYDISTVRMTVVQPRLDNITTETLSTSELLNWAESQVRPVAELAIKGLGEFETGAHCRFCRAAAVCRKRAETMMATAAYDFKVPPVLEDDEIPAILEIADELSEWINAITSYALRAAEAGARFAGWKLVEGRATRRYANEDAVLERLKFSGFEEAIITKRSLLGLTEMEKTIGKKPFAEILGELIIRPAGKPALVRATDKRPELQSAATAETDFKEGNE